MTEEQLEALIDYIDVAIDYAIACENDSVNQYCAGTFKDKMESRLREILITPVPLNRRAIV